MQLRVLIVDEHPIVIDSLLVILNKDPDITVVGAATNGMEGLAQLRRLRPDCMVFDVNQPKSYGMEAIGLYLRESPDLGIVIYSEATDDLLVNMARQAGVRAYVSKGEPVSALAGALREVHNQRERG